jgi:hypothetical protein
MTGRHFADEWADGDCMSVTFDVSQLDSAVRAAQEFQPSPELQAAGAFIRFLKNSGAQRAVEIGVEVVADPCINMTDRVMTLQWLEKNEKA